MSQEGTEAQPESWSGDLALSLGVGLFLSLSPFTPSLLGTHWATSVSIGLATAALFLLGRVNGWVPALASGDVRGWLETRAPWALAACALTIAVLMPSLLEMGSRFTTSIWQNGHGLFVPVAMVWAARRKLERGRIPEAVSSPMGLPLLLVAAALQIESLRVEEALYGSLAIVLAIPGLSWLLAGTAITRRLAAPLSLSIFMVPIGYESAFHPMLQQATATMTNWVLQSAGVSVYQEGIHLTLRHGSFTVSDACSGFSTLYASGATAAFLSMMALPSRRWLVLALAVPLALATNAFRVIGLIGLAALDPTLLDTWAHKGTGVLAFVISLAGLVLISGALRVSSSDPEGPDS